MKTHDIEPVLFPEIPADARAARESKPLLSPEPTYGWMPAGRLRWIVAGAIFGLLVIGSAYVRAVERADGAVYPAATAIAEPGATALPSTR